MTFFPISTFLCGVKHHRRCRTGLRGGDEDVHEYLRE